MSSSKAFVVIGAGPGIGRTTAALFAERGFDHIILLSRNESRLKEDADAVQKSAGSTKSVTVDTIQLDLAGDEGSIRQTLTTVDEKLRGAGSQLEVVLYNGARVGPSMPLEWEAKALETDLRITTVSLYIVLQWAIPQLRASSNLASSNPAFLTTSGGLYRQPFPFLFSLAAGKASQQNLVHSFHSKYEPQVHVGLVVVKGVVADDAKVTSAKAIAEKFWELYKQQKGMRGNLNIEMNDPDYDEMVESMRKQAEGE